MLHNSIEIDDTFTYKEYEYLDELPVDGPLYTLEW